MKVTPMKNDQFSPKALILACLACSALPATAADASNAALRLAKAMSAAADAEAHGNKKALANAVRTIDASGSHPLDASEHDPLPIWRSAAAGVGSPPYRGRPLGPGYRSGTIDQGGHDSFSQLFLSGNSATIALSAPTGDRLALRVLDPQAKPICEDGTGRGGLCKWVPLFTQRYTIEVANIGKGDARYFLVVQ